MHPTPATLAALREIARSRTPEADPAHDWLHVERVTRNAERLAKAEGADPTVATLSALLHELVNLPKSHPESHRSGELCAVAARELLRDHDLDDAVAARVAEAIRTHPFSMGVTPATVEGRILQDADRLDAIGAIGVARCFSTCTTMGRPFYRSDDPFCEGREPEDKLWGVDHFFRKLLRVGDAMHTAAARAMAAERTEFLRQYLAQLAREVGA